jgi:hypothetical protein
MHEIREHQVSSAILHLEIYSERVFCRFFKILHSFFCCFIKTRWISPKTNFASNLLCTTTTYSEKPEGTSSREREILRVFFKNPVVFITNDKHSTGHWQQPEDADTVWRSGS